VLWHRPLTHPTPWLSAPCPFCRHLVSWTFFNSCRCSYPPSPHILNALSLLERTLLHYHAARILGLKRLDLLSSSLASVSNSPTYTVPCLLPRITLGRCLDRVRRPSRNCSPARARRSSMHEGGSGIWVTNNTMASKPGSKPHIPPGSSVPIHNEEGNPREPWGQQHWQFTGTPPPMSALPGGSSSSSFDLSPLPRQRNLSYTIKSDHGFAAASVVVVEPHHPCQRLRGRLVEPHPGLRASRSNNNTIRHHVSRRRS
jgi:hypothetical protein